MLQPVLIIFKFDPRLLCCYYVYSSFKLYEENGPERKYYVAMEWNLAFDFQLLWRQNVLLPPLPPQGYVLCSMWNRLMSKMKFISAYRTFTRLQLLLVVLWLPFISTTCDHVCKSPILVWFRSFPSVLQVCLLLKSLMKLLTPYNPWRRRSRM